MWNIQRRSHDSGKTNTRKSYQPMTMPPQEIPLPGSNLRSLRDGLDPNGQSPKMPVEAVPDMSESVRVTQSPTGRLPRDDIPRAECSLTPRQLLRCNSYRDCFDANRSQVSVRLRRFWRRPMHRGERLGSGLTRNGPDRRPSVSRRGKTASTRDCGQSSNESGKGPGTGRPWSRNVCEPIGIP